MVFFFHWTFASHRRSALRTDGGSRHLRCGMFLAGSLKNELKDAGFWFGEIESRGGESIRWARKHRVKWYFHLHSC